MQNAVAETQSYEISPAFTNAIIVVGAGLAGFRFIEEFRSLDSSTPIILFGDEPYLPYDRVKLSAYLAGVQTPEDLQLPLDRLNEDPNFLYIQAGITEVKPDDHQIVDAQGSIYSYSKLVLATGSRPHMPEIEGAEMTGVYTFRNMRDTESLKARTMRTRHLVILGGGLLGIEAARALRQNNTKVTIVELASHLMNRQLDQRAAELLQQELETQEFEVLTSQGISKISGNSRVETVTLRDGTVLDCDTVLISTGIKPNMEMARSAWLKVGRGIRVNDQLQTSNPDIYAIGECAEHNDQIYGLAAPGLEQAAIAAHHAHGEETQYLGSYNVAKLKLADVPVFSIGEIDEDLSPSMKSYCFEDDGLYRKVCLKQGRVVGAVAIGDWAETPRIQELITHKRKLNRWKLGKFCKTGNLFNPNEAANPNLWPEGAVICNCNNVSRGTISDAIELGCCSVTEISDSTRAGSTCGSCKPLLQEMIGDGAQATPDSDWKSLITTAFISVALCVALFFLPGLEVSQSVQGGFKFESIWNDGFIKQITGFTLLSMVVIGLFMSARKRLNKINIGTFSFWRLLHIVLGIFALFLLFAHTGMHSGSNLNFMLLSNFLALSILGAVAAVAISMQFKLSTSLGKRLRTTWFWAHLLLAWPLPALLGFHILSVYYF